MENGIVVGSSRISCRYIEKKRIRNAYLRFRGDTLVVVADSERKAEQAIKENNRWIEKHYNSIKNSVRLFGRNTIYLNGRRFVALFKDSRGISVDAEKDAVIFGAGSKGSAEHLVDRWLGENSLKLASDIASAKAQQSGIKYKGIRLCRGSKWGSCSSSHELRFNRYLCMLPSSVAGYVVAHELAHTIELNHSASFWKQVGALCADYKGLRKELKAYDSYRREVF